MKLVHPHDKFIEYIRHVESKLEIKSAIVAPIELYLIF